MPKRQGAAKSVRHGKKYWRRGVDIGDVDDALERQREDERLGVDVTAPDAALFAIDRTAEQLKPDADVAGVKIEPDEVLRARRKPKRPVTVDTMKLARNRQFTNRSAIPAVISHKTPGELRNTMRLLKTERMQAQRAGRSLRACAAKPAPTAKTHLFMHDDDQANAVTYDVWNEPNVPKSKVLSADHAYIEDYFLQTTKRIGSRRPPKALPAHERDKILPAAVSVDQLTGGSSYNPDKAEYEHLLDKSLQLDAVKLRAEQKIDKRLAVRKQDMVTPEQRFRELAEGVLVDDSPRSKADAPIALDEYESDFDETKPEDKPDVQPTTAATAKTRAHRRRERAQKAVAEKAAAEKRAKKRSNEIFGLKRITAMLNANDERSLKASVKRREARSHRRMKLGRHDYEQSVIPVAMPDQLGVPLRLLKPDGDLLHDRWKSMQERNLIAPTQRAKRIKRAKVKIVERRNEREELRN